VRDYHDSKVSKTTKMLENVTTCRKGLATSKSPEHCVGINYQAPCPWPEAFDYLQIIARNLFKIWGYNLYILLYAIRSEAK
jgi:hypothetical protein